MQINDIFEYSGLTEKEFAKMYDIPKKKLSKWLSGEKECPTYVLRLLYLAVPIAANLRRIEFDYAEKGKKNKESITKQYVIIYNNTVISDQEIKDLINSGDWKKYNEANEKFIVTTPKAGAATLGSD